MSRQNCLTEQLRMRSASNKVDPVCFHLVDQQKVAADMAFAVIGPIPLQRVIQPFRTQRGIVRDQQQHRVFEPRQVITP